MLQMKLCNVKKLSLFYLVNIFMNSLSIESGQNLKKLFKRGPLNKICTASSVSRGNFKISQQISKKVAIIEFATSNFIAFSPRASRSTNDIVVVVVVVLVVVVGTRLKILRVQQN